MIGRLVCLHKTHPHAPAGCFTRTLFWAEVIESQASQSVFAEYHFTSVLIHCLSFSTRNKLQPVHISMSTDLSHPFSREVKSCRHL